MPIGNTANSYGSVSKTFHWLTALLILILIPLGLIAQSSADSLKDATLAVTPETLARTAWLFSLHKTLGILLFFTALARVLWGIRQPRPEPLSDARRQTLLADSIHWLLYASLILAPLAGWAHHAATRGFASIWWPFGQSLPFIAKSDSLAATFAGLHAMLVGLLVLTILLHIAGALKHHLIDRNATLRRMLPGPGPLAATYPRRRSILPLLGALGVLVLTISLSLMRHSDAPPEQTTSASLPQTTASNWTITTGSLDLTVTLFGSGLSGSFSDWTADITFAPPTDPGPAGTVTVTINIASLTLGSVSQQAMGPDYFDIERFPTATFTATLEKTASGYTATGPLTIRDQSVMITLPFELTVMDDIATMTATLPLNRLDFGIAPRSADESTLGYGVNLTIALTAQHRPKSVSR